MITILEAKDLTCTDLAEVNYTHVRKTSAIAQRSDMVVVMIEGRFKVIKDRYKTLSGIHGYNFDIGLCINSYLQDSEDATSS